MSKSKTARQPRPNECRAHLRKRYQSQAALVEEYIKESEHQDGSGYWANFATLKDVAEDFLLYARSSQEDQQELDDKIGTLIADNSVTAFLHALAVYMRGYAEDPLAPPPKHVRQAAENIAACATTPDMLTCARVLDEDVRAGFPMEDDTEPEVLAWNTGRQYTKEGQRIAAVRVAGGIVFVDVDRGIDGFIVDVPFTEARILEAYDNNRYTGQFYQFDEERRMLEERARLVPAIAKRSNP